MLCCTDRGKWVCCRRYCQASFVTYCKSKCHHQENAVITLHLRPTVPSCCLWICCPHRRPSRCIFPPGSWTLCSVAVPPAPGRRSSPRWSRWRTETFCSARPPAAGDKGELLTSDQTLNIYTKWEGRKAEKVKGWRVAVVKYSCFWLSSRADIDPVWNSIARILVTSCIIQFDILHATEFIVNEVFCIILIISGGGSTHIIDLSRSTNTTPKILFYK